MADLIVREFSGEGDLVETAHKFYPTYLDWMDIKVKAFWFTLMADGDPRTRFALLESQGQQKLIMIEGLARLDLKAIKEKEHGVRQLVQDYIDRNGLSRVPRNQ